MSDRLTLLKGEALVGLLLAPVLPSLIASVSVGLWLGDLIGAVVITFVVAEATAFALGIPLISLLQGRIKPKVIWAALFGGFVAVFPWLVLCVIVLSLGESGVLWTMSFLVGIFGLGAIGGVCFWMLTIWRNHLNRPTAR